jgi:hypothetical protein
MLFSNLTQSDSREKGFWLTDLIFYVYDGWRSGTERKNGMKFTLRRKAPRRFRPLRERIITHFEEVFDD